MENKYEEYLKMLLNFQVNVENIYGEYRGFAHDGPVDSKKWFSDSCGKRILFLLKEAYGYDDDEICYIMDAPERFNDSRTNLAISRLAYAIDRSSESIKYDTEYVSDDDLFKLMDMIHEELETVTLDDLKHSYSKIAIVEIKKISGEIKSIDSDIRKHSKQNEKFLSDQIRFLSPDVIVCCGYVTWESLTQDMSVFEKFAFSSNDRGIYNSNGIIVYNSYHPSFYGFNRYDIAYDIIKSFCQNR